MKRSTFRNLSLALATVLVASIGVYAQTTDPAETNDPQTETPAPEKPKNGSQAIDKVQNAVHKIVETPVSWFDSLFGDARAFEEANRTWGRLQLGGRWDEQDGEEAIASLRVKVFLPAMERRLSAVLGRLPEEEIVREEQYPDTAFTEMEEDDQDWLLGLDYAPVDGKGQRVNFGVGARFASPVEPYVKIRYRLWQPLGKNTAFRFRLTPYWQDGDRQYGIRSSTDVDHRIRPRLLFRWTTSGFDDDTTLGVRYGIATVLYHKLSARNAMAYRIGVHGQTEADVRATEYGLYGSFRRRLSREWLFLETGAGVGWRRRTLEEEREPVVVGELLVEMQFGKKPN